MNYEAIVILSLYLVFLSLVMTSFSDSLASESNAKAAGEFYAVNNHGIFISADSGVSWRRLDIQCPKEYLSQNPWALAIRQDE